MGKGRSNGKAGPPDEAADIALTLAAIRPAIKAGVPVQRMGATAGAHPADMQGFLDGRVSLTWALRKRLREQAPSLLDGSDPGRNPS
jgi:hypothetical protein